MTNRILNTLGYWAAIYLSGALIALDWNPGHWWLAGKIIAGILALLFSGDLIEDGKPTE
jgi:hypothetical protein